MKKQSLLLLPAMLLSSAAMAETVSPEQALDKALQYLQQPARARGHQAPSLSLAHTAAAKGETYYYVFNNAAGGYIIMGGDDAAYDVLAYSDHGTFDADAMPPAMKWLLGQYEHQIHSVIAANHKGTTMRRAAARTLDFPEIEPMLGGTEWNQCLPYNALIMGSGQMEDRLQRYATGCVATAMAQVMRYWQYPERGFGKKAYQMDGVVQEANFATSEYRWDLMQDKYTEAYSGTPEEDAVALLMSDAGVAVNMRYNKYYSSGSGANSYSIAYALRTFFGYSNELMMAQRDAVELEPGVWEQMIYGELVETGPIIYNGSDPEEGTGHCFVCDGYKDGLFHINWGWSGLYNDYFRLTPTNDLPALNPEGDEIGSNDSENYSGNQSVIVGIKPEPETQGFVYASERATIPSVISPDEPLHIETKLCNPTDKPYMGGVEFALLDENGLFTDTTLIRGAELMLMPHEEAVLSFDFEPGSLVPGAKYMAAFVTFDISDLELGSAPRPWFYEIDDLQVEGPDWVVVSMKKGYNVVCVPFDFKLEGDVVAYTATSVNADNEVELKPVSQIEAGGCYVLVGEPSNVPVVLYGMPQTDEVWSEDGIFIGNMTKEYQLMDDIVYGFSTPKGKEPRFKRTTRATGVGPHRVVVKGTAAEAELLFLNFDNTATGIQEVNEPRCILRYSIMGQPLQQSQGLMISNGRISFVK